MELDSLWARVMKARYFPRSSFIEARKGCRASWAWTSLLEGREIILRGANWQVMNGRNIKLWVDRWAPSLPNGHPNHLEPANINWNQNVASIIRSSSNEWDLQPISSCVPQSEMARIKDLHIGDPDCDDKLIWPSEKSGMYTVKSGYHWLHNREALLLHRRSSLLASIDKRVWKNIWKLEVLAKDQTVYVAHSP